MLCSLTLFKDLIDCLINYFRTDVRKKLDIAPLVIKGATLRWRYVSLSLQRWQNTSSFKYHNIFFEFTVSSDNNFDVTRLSVGMLLSCCKESYQCVHHNAYVGLFDSFSYFIESCYKTIATLSDC